MLGGNTTCRMYGLGHAGLFYRLRLYSYDFVGWEAEWRCIHLEAIEVVFWTGDPEVDENGCIPVVIWFDNRSRWRESSLAGVFDEKVEYHCTSAVVLVVDRVH